MFAIYMLPVAFALVVVTIGLIAMGSWKLAKSVFEMTYLGRYIAWRRDSKQIARDLHICKYGSCSEEWFDEAGRRWGEYGFLFPDTAEDVLEATSERVAKDKPAPFGNYADPDRQRQNERDRQDRYDLYKDCFFNGCDW